MERSNSPEALINPQSIDEQVDSYLNASPEEQVRRWTTIEFVSAFPQMVRRFLSPSGLEKYGQEARSTFYDASLSALKEFPISKKFHSDFIPASGIDYDIERETVVSLGGERPYSVDSLFRIDLAGIILLGLSEENYGAAMRKFTDTYRDIGERGPKANRTIKEIVDMHLTTRSRSRRWVKTHGLDYIIGGNWDGAIAELICNLPENEIDVERNYPRRPPRELLHPDAPKVYSEETLGVFVDYAAQYAEDLPMTPSRAKDLVDFSLNIRRMPREFLAKTTTQDALRVILNATNKIDSSSSYGHIPDARELLPNYKSPRTRNIRWYSRGVKELMK